MADWTRMGGGKKGGGEGRLVDVVAQNPSCEHMEGGGANAVGSGTLKSSPQISPSLSSPSEPSDVASSSV